MPGAGGDPDLTDSLTDYVATLERSSMREAVALVAALGGSGVPLRRIIDEVLAPAQVEVGRRWETGRWTVAQEHTATGITEVALQTAVLSAEGLSPAAAGRPRLVLACADGEWHSLSARMAADLLSAAGIDVVYVGAALPHEALVEFVVAQRPTAVGLSCSTVMALVGARETVAQVHARGLPVLVSGTAFGSDARRAEAIGADAWVATAGEAAAVLGGWAVRPPATLRTPWQPDHDEWVRLATAPAEWVDGTLRELLVQRPRLSTVSTSLVARLRKETAYLLRAVSAVQLTGDGGLLHEYTAWLRGVMEARRVPADVLADLYACAAGTLSDEAPRAASLLSESRNLLTLTGTWRETRPVGE